MADPERDFGMVYDEKGFIQILQSPFFDVDPEVDHAVEGYVARILDTIVLAVEEQLGTVEWRLASDPQTSLQATIFRMGEWILDHEMLPANALRGHAPFGRVLLWPQDIFNRFFWKGIC
ncbi:hypothetical protein M5K25_003263 [Dendrobium thyrsiflorum]|uniref:Uncharacterized protein n=1 Tax=Dendrobium thyrsiflorum TaxID=117978 RepID=A0ABD0VQR7_DENTH